MIQRVASRVSYHALTFIEFLVRRADYNRTRPSTALRLSCLAVYSNVVDTGKANTLHRMLRYHTRRKLFSDYPSWPVVPFNADLLDYLNVNRRSAVRITSQRRQRNELITSGREPCLPSLRREWFRGSGFEPPRSSSSEVGIPIPFRSGLWFRFVRRRVILFWTRSVECNR